ncbi:MAG: oligosaccharide flippase family protein [Bacteroidia bacterium]
MSKLKSLAGQTAIYGLSSIIGRMLNYLLVPLYTYAIFTPDEYGVVTELYAYVTFLLVIYTYGMETGFFHFSNRESDSRKVFSTSFNSLLILSGLFSGIIFLLAPNIATTLSYPQHPEFFQYIALTLAFDTLATVPFAQLRKDARPKKFALIKISNILINIGFNLFFLIACPAILASSAWSALHPFINAVYNPETGVGYVFLSHLLASAFTLPMLWKEISRLRAWIDLPLLRKMLIYCSPLVIVGFAGMINETIDRILLKYLLPGDTEYRLAQLGIYGACYKLSIFMTLAIQSFRMGAEPFFFAQFKEQDAQQTYAKVMRYFAILGCFIFLVVVLYIDIAKFIIGPDYRSGLVIVPILLLANLFLGMYYILSIWYKATDRTRYGALISVMGAIITLGLNISLIPVIGYMAAAWATLAAYGSMAIAGYFLGQRFYPVPYPVFTILAYVAFALLLFFISLGISQIVFSAGFVREGLNIWMLIINTGFLAIFVAVVFGIERKNLRLSGNNFPKPKDQNDQ